jgi:hypothetical protein
MRRFLHESTVFLFLLSVDASATVFKCEMDGKVVLQDIPCANDATQVSLMWLFKMTIKKIQRLSTTRLQP